MPVWVIALIVCLGCAFSAFLLVIFSCLIVAANEDMKQTQEISRRDG